MSETTADARSRSNSNAIMATEHAAAAFGEDLADDCYSVTEMSYYDQGKSKASSKSKSKNGGHHDTFARSRFRRLEREDSIMPESHPSEENGSDDRTRKSSMGSPGQSDETGGASADSEDSDVTISSFVTFGQAKFQMKIQPLYSCSALPHPLLPKQDKAEYLASLACWVTVLRIMGDLPDVDIGDTLAVAGSSVPVTSKVKSAFKTKYTKKDVDDAHKKYTELFKDPTGTDTRSLPFLTEVADSMLDKIQMVCAVGIYKPSLRDEIYCQVCKQLTNNPSRNSTMRGWVLLSLLAGSFAPSEVFSHVFTNFLRDSPAELSEKVDRLLRRTCSVGTRGYPPSWLEFQAAKNGKPLLIPVNFMSGLRMLFEVDSAMTVAEVIRHVGERLGLQDVSGYSIYISLHTKISCLGHGQHRVMDAISECEQNTRQMGMRERSTAWRMYFRREYFSPWFNPGEDPVDTDLVYQQVKRGITLGEYKIEKEEILLNLTAKIYYVEYPDDMGYYNLATFVNSFIPEAQQERRPKDYFQDKVRNIYEDLGLGTKKPPPLTIKVDIARYAMNEMYILFSRYYDVAKVVGPNLHITEVVVGVNGLGIYVVDNIDTLRLRVQYPEIVDIIKTKHHITLCIANMDDFVFSTNHSDDFFNTVTTNIEELKKRSTVAIAKQDFTQLDGPADTTVLKGDILELSQTTADLGDSDVMTALCTRTKKPCDIPVKLIYVIPTLETLPESLIERLSRQICKNAVGFTSMEKQQQPSLQQYAKTHFRPANENAVTKFFNKASIKKKDADHLWSWTKDKLKKPLLKRTCNRDDVRKVAVYCFSSIQDYMNQAENDGNASYNLCTAWILNPARRNKYLREEIYCQVVKQLTNNPDRTSADRGWRLLTMLTSLTPPSGELTEHIVTFLQGCNHPLAKQCETNIKRKKRRGGYRLYPSHPLEHEMVARHETHVTVQVFLPDQSHQSLEVTSHSRIFDLKKEIATRMGLKSFHEYSLFLTGQDKVYCLPNRAYYFDCLALAEIYWFKNSNRNSDITSRPGSATRPPTPSMVMLKKIWVNGQPGRDQTADLIFHYHQELPNYLRSYHQMPDVLVNKLAALVYIAQGKSADQPITNFRELASQIFPRGYMDGKKDSDVQQAFQKELQQRKVMTPQEAKTVFVQELSRLATYGAVFCEVKQRQLKVLPAACLVAINYSGVHFIDATTKSILKTSSFESIPNWAYDDFSFTVIIAEAGKTTKLLLETTVGHNMDDLLMSYVAWILNLEMRKKSGHIGDMSGESIC